MNARLYLVTPPSFDPDAFAGVLDGALACGAVDCVRLALETGDEAVLKRAAGTLLEVAASRDTALVIADRVDLVRPLRLDGVHLSDSRTGVREAREAVGADRIVGAHAFASRHRAMTLAEAGADYVSAGPVRGDGAVGDDFFEWWAEVVETPVVAEGGITVEGAARLSAWADFVVPDPTVWRAEDPAADVAAYSAALAP